MTFCQHHFDVNVSQLHLSQYHHHAFAASWIQTSVDRIISISMGSFLKDVESTYDARYDDFQEKSKTSRSKIVVSDPMTTSLDSMALPFSIQLLIGVFKRL